MSEPIVKLLSGGSGNVEDIENIIVITGAVTVLISALLILTMVLSYIKRLYDSSKRAVATLLGIADKTAEFVISIGRMTVDGLDEALADTKELLGGPGDDLKSSADPIKDSIGELQDTVRDGINRVSTSFGLQTTKTRTNSNKLLNGVTNMVPDIDVDGFNKARELSEQIADPVVPGPPEDPEVTKMFTGRWHVPGDGVYPDEIINIVHISGNNYRYHYYYDPNNNPLYYDKIGYYNLHNQYNVMFGEATYNDLSRTATYFALEMNDDKTVDWKMFQLDDITKVWSYNPNVKPAAVFIREGDVEYELDGITMVF